MKLKEKKKIEKQLKELDGPRFKFHLAEKADVHYETVRKFFLSNTGHHKIEEAIIELIKERKKFHQEIKDALNQ